LSEERIYQPGWGEKKDKKHRHHHLHRSDSRYTNSWGGWLKMRDKQAYYGLMFVVVVGLLFGAYKVVQMFVHEFRSMPLDDPRTEMKVDELDVRRGEKQDALIAGDSIKQAFNVDSIRRVQTESHHVYRPPRRENKWYITQREWKDIWRNMKRWKQAQKNDDRVKEKEEKKSAE
jgi:hypothetical protein